MIRRICKWLVFKIVYPCSYVLGCVGKVKQNKVIFVENHQDDLSDNFLLLKEALEKSGYQITIHYLKVASSSWTSIIKRTIGLLLDMGTARAVVIAESNSAFGAFRLRKQTRLIQIWHACGAFKKWGFSVANKSFGEDADELKRYSGHKNYTLVPVSGEKVVWAYEEAFGLEAHKNLVVPMGVSRTDVYFDKEKIKFAKDKIREFVGFEKRIILYAPTFRGDIKGASYPEGFDIEKFCDKLGDSCVLLIKNHPFVKNKYKIPEKFSSVCYEIVDEYSMEELLMSADVCVTDYSSIVFEYSLLKKPILFYAYDLDAYYDERGFYYSYEEFVPGPIVKTMEELIEQINNVEQIELSKVEKFAKAYMSGCDGHSTERLVSYIEGGC